MQKYFRHCIKTSVKYEKWALFLYSFAQNSVVPCSTNTMDAIFRYGSQRPTRSSLILWVATKTWMRIGAKYAERFRSELSPWAEKTRLPVRITESFMMTSRGSLWRIALPVRVSCSATGSMARGGYRKRDSVSNSSLPNYSQVLRKGMRSR